MFSPLIKKLRSHTNQRRGQKQIFRYKMQFNIISINNYIQTKFSYT